MKIKNKIKTLLVKLFVPIMALLLGLTTVYAEQLTIVKRRAWYIRPSAIPGVSEEAITVVTHNGNPAFCIEPPVAMSFKDIYSTTSPETVSAVGNTQDVKLFLYYAMKDGMGDNYINYGATQLWLWSYANGYNPTIVRGVTTDAAVRQRQAEIQALFLMN